ncbi:Na+/H+ antiporter subunit E [Orrella daihaiensis]|uniref:Na+/H+ antiporter subunit E n=1 Tax=Orrella daihaiensis TaxID=2782176 RepID=A0ABY4AJI3_9BURK|nr:Na+/H+ antiporter subunit E [Orrella daihaiensis]UOD50444.1 Na+/H+ antiporter subunit E [Orrella daihaiensis]
MHIVVLFITLAALWLLWSGLYLPLMLALGAASVVLVIWLTRRFETIDHESVPVHLGFKVITYWAWLLKEIVVSSLQVTKIVLSPSMPISPKVVQVQSKSKGEVRQVIFGNSITLTPGTLTTDLDDNGLVTVHALTEEGADGVVNGDMNDRVAALPGFGGK